MALKKSGVMLTAEGFADYINKLQQVNKANREAFDTKPQQNYNKAHDETQKKVKETQSVFGGLRQSMGQIASGDVTGGVLNLVKSFASLKAGIVGVGAALGALKLLQYLRESGKVAVQNETMGVVLEQVGKNSKYTAEQTNYALQSVKKMGITTSAASHSLVQLAQSEIGWTNASKLARIAQDAAVIGMTDSSDAFQRLIWGIKTGQTDVLRTVGLNVNFEMSYRKMAQSLGKSVTALTESEKAQARANAVMEAGTTIAGSYEAAMGTAGKMQSSMARLIEETKNNVGQLVLPIETLVTKMKYDFLKGTETASQGLRTWGAAIQATIDMLGTLAGATEETSKKTPGEWIGKVLHDAGRTLAEMMILMAGFIAGLQEMFKVLQVQLEQTFSSRTVKVIEALIAGMAGDTAKMGKLMKEAWEAQPSEATKAGESAGDAFRRGVEDKMLKMTQDLEKKWPELFLEFGEAAEKVSLDKQATEAEKLAASLKTQTEELQTQIAVMRQVEAVWKNYQDAVDQAGKQLERDSKKMHDNLSKQQQQLAKRTAQRLADLEKDSQKRRNELIKDAYKQQAEDQRKAQRDSLMEIKRFELEKAQSLRQFKLNERRLMAEGDVLGLMRLREDYDLQRKEAQENFNLQQEDSKTAQEEAQRQQREDIQTRLEELDADIAERRQSIQDSYSEELENLRTNFAEQMAERQTAYEDQIAQLQESRNKQLQELGASLKDQAGLTQEGMENIANEMAKTFGEQGAADALMTGWKERTKSAMDEAIGYAESQISALNRRIEELETYGREQQAQSEGRRYGNIPMPSSPDRESEGARFGRGIGMRRGGIGVVTGPALFEVEPGVREVVAFAPVRQGATRGRLDVGVSGGIDIRGAEGASPGIVDAAVSATLFELQQAVARMAKK